MRSFLTLDIGGIITAFFFGILIFVMGISYGTYLLGVMLLFLALAALVTGFGKKRKARFKSYPERRGWKNVVANGVVPLIVALLYFVSAGSVAGPSKILIVAFVASVAAVSADKFSSEIGVLDGEPVMLLTLKKTRKGSSGAVTLVGLIMGLDAALIISFSLLFVGFSIYVVGVATLAGFAGSLVDSIAGYFEEKNIGNKFTSNVLCSLAGFLLAVALLMMLNVSLSS